MSDFYMLQRQMSFKVGSNTVTFYRLYNDCWVCVLPEMTAKRIKFETGQMRVDELNLSVRAENVFKSWNILTIDDVLERNYELLKLSNFGIRTYKEIVSLLDINGLFEAAHFLRLALKKKQRIPFSRTTNEAHQQTQPTSDVR